MPVNPSAQGCLVWLLPHAERRGAPDYTLIHSAAPLHPTDTETTLPAGKTNQKKKKTHFFHQLLKAMQRRRRRHNFRILKTMVSGRRHGAASVRGRWANFRVTSANTNNCSGSLSLSALEVGAERFKAPRPISLPPYFPPRMIRLHPRPQSASRSSTVGGSTVFICTQA